MSKSRITLAICLGLAALTFTMCCKQSRSTAETMQAAAVKQGITGRVEVWEGNFMPMVDKENANNKITPAVGRRVRVHEPLKMDGGLATAKRGEVPTPLVVEAVTDSAGHFAIAVAPGTYSIFVEEDGGWYYNGWNSDGIQGAVTVEPEKTSEVLIKITTKATF